MGTIPISDRNQQIVSPDANNYAAFAAMSQGGVDWNKSLPVFGHLDYEPRFKWFEREDARWLIIRDALRTCAKKNIRDVAHRMELQGCPGCMGLYDILHYIAKI